jgi:hypothetical protein
MSEVIPGNNTSIAIDSNTDVSFSGTGLVGFAAGKTISVDPSSLGLGSVASSSIVGNNTGSTAPAIALTPSEARSVLQVGTDAYRSDERRISLGFLLTWGASPATIATVARASNIATVTTSTNHGMIVGQFVEVNAGVDNTFDATGSSFATVLSVPTPNSFTYANTGANKSQTADSGIITTWNVVNDAGHATQRNCRLQSITAAGVQVQWDDLPAGTWRVESGTLGNHQNNANAVFTPFHNAVGLTNCTIALRFRRTLFGRVWWNGTTTGGGITANANWVKEGDSGSVSYVDSTINALFIGHSSIELPTAGSRGVSSWPMPDLQQCGNGATPVLPNYQISPFTADAYRPSGTGFWCQLLDASGNIMNQAAIEALSPASRAQIMWSRTADQVLTDHRRPLAAVTVFCAVNLIRV